MFKALFRHLFLSVAAWLFCKALLPSEILLRLAKPITILFPGELMNIANSFSTNFPTHKLVYVISWDLVNEYEGFVIHLDSVDPGRSFPPVWGNVLSASYNPWFIWSTAPF